MGKSDCQIANSFRKEIVPRDRTDDAPNCRITKCHVGVGDGGCFGKVLLFYGGG